MLPLKHIIPCFSFFILLCSGPVCGQDTAYGDDIRKTIEKKGQAEVIIDYPGYTSMSEITSRFSVSSCDGKSAILSISPLTASDFIQSGIHYTLYTPGSAKEVYTASSVSEAMQWHSYPTWKQYDTIMHLLAETWPDVCILDTIGYSVMGRAIPVLKISDNPGVREDEPAVMLSSSMHGDELAGFVLLMRLAEYLASRSSDGGLTEKLVSGLEIWINPLANPDGMYRTYDSIINPVRANENGYDLNRNFPDPEVSGPPALQPETMDMIAFMRKNHCTLSANFHSGSEVVNYPWDKWLNYPSPPYPVNTPWLHADDTWFNAICRRYADTVHLHSPYGYLNDLDNGVTRGSVWYTVRGGRQDFVTYELAGREVTIEIDDIKQTPASELEALWDYNHRSMLRYMEEAMSGIRGTVTSETDGLPLDAKIFITGHDKDSSQVYSDTLTGTFYRLIEPGTWDLTVSCEGYETQVVENVTVEEHEQTIVNILMQPDLPGPFPDPPLKGLLIYPVPTEGPVLILTPEVVSGTVTVTVVSSAGSVIRKYTMMVEPGIPFPEDFSDLSAGFYFIEVRKMPDGPGSRGKVSVSSCVQR